MAKIKCPHCNEEFGIAYMSTIQEEDVVYLHYKGKSELIDAKTIGKLILNMDALEIAIAKDLGFKSVVFIKSIEYIPPEITIGFLITEVKKSPGSNSRGD